LRPPLDRTIIRAMRRFVVLLGVLGALAILAVGETGSDAATTTTRRPLVGSYSLVTKIEKPRRIVARATLVIDTYNPSTGAITGHGVSEDIVPFSMTGTVRGSTITMRVVNVYGVASDRGRIYPDGTIRGTIVAAGRGVRQSGTWLMMPSVVAVQEVGLTVEHLGHQVTEVTYGIEIRNTSNTRDASNVRVDIRPLTKSGKVAGGDLPFFLVAPINAIPAGQTFYLGGGQNLHGAVPVARLRVTVIVGSTPVKRYVLPPVSDVRVDAARGRVTATMTNPYRTSISAYDYTASAVFYDRSGKIVGGDALGTVGDLGSRELIKPGQRAPVRVLIPFRISWERIASARITVTPT
jgi:hypothetical protein